MSEQDMSLKKKRISKGWIFLVIAVVCIGFGVLMSSATEDLKMAIILLGALGSLLTLAGIVLLIMAIISLIRGYK